MEKLVKEVEKLSGKKFITEEYQTEDSQDWDEVQLNHKQKRDEEIENWENNDDEKKGDKPEVYIIPEKPKYL